MTNGNDRLSVNLGASIGLVYNVDTRKIIVNVTLEEILNRLKINDIVMFNGNTADEKLIGIITRVSKKMLDNDDVDEGDEDNSELCNLSENICIVILVGTFCEKFGAIKNCEFKRAINTYPEINSPVYIANEKALYIIMNAVANKTSGKNLQIGKFASNIDVAALLDGNRFFQRHACIVGSTGSGKSWAVANMLEKIKELEFSNVILFDLHGEYNELEYAKQIKISSDNGGLKIPLWFFNYEEIHSLFIESSEGTSVNQRAVVIEYILNSKKEYIEKEVKQLSKEIITADTPIPFSALEMKNYLNEKNNEEIKTGEIYKTGEKTGQEKTKQGQYYDKLTNLITRLQSKIDDKKYAFIFNESGINSHTYLNKFAAEILEHGNGKKNIKIIDLSEIPSDILPIIIGIVTRIIYDIQFWMSPKKGQVRHPLVFVCDEAHIYMPNDYSKMKAVERKSLEIFERIAKEGRKYGIGLLIVSQRPSELNSTIVSQCNNIICLKITNERDKNAVGSMLTDSLAGITDMLPNLDVGECVAIGDAIMLPSKIILQRPEHEPKSATIEFWDKWDKNTNTVFDIDNAIISLIKQTR